MPSHRVGGGPAQTDCLLEPEEINIHGGAFKPHTTALKTEKQARRIIDPMKARTWAVSNPRHHHPITGMCRCRPGPVRHVMGP